MSLKKVSSLSGMKVSELANMAKTQITGKQYVDTYLAKGTTFSRIQTSKTSKTMLFMLHINSTIRMNTWVYLEKI